MAGSEHVTSGLNAKWCSETTQGVTVRSDGHTVTQWLGSRMLNSIAGWPSTSALRSILKESAKVK